VKILFVILFSLLINSQLFAGKEAFNWFFGENAGITFNTPGLEPVAINNGALISEEGCAAISDANGNVLFYTNGVTVWNKNNFPMQNGKNLMGDTSSTQSAIIIPKPGSTKLYYIITTNDANGSNECRYSVVDISRQVGLGEVISKNRLLFNAATEKLLAIRHANGKDWWLLVHEWQSDVFRAYILDNNGINKFAVFSIAGSSHNGDKKNKAGYLKASKNGTKLALALPEEGMLELFDFNPMTGRVSNPVSLKALVLKDVYGLEFSPSGRKLFVTKQEYPSAIFQYDLSNWTQSGILNTQALIKEEKCYGAFQALQIGPDNKIYVARYNRKFLGRINSPEKIGRFCNYIDSAVYLKEKISKRGLPNIYSNDIVNININAQSKVCIGEVLLLSVNNIFGASYNWTGPDNFNSNKREVSVKAHSILQSGFYKLTVHLSGMTLSDSIFVVVSPSPNLNISVTANQPLCYGDSAKLTAQSDENVKYLWSTGDTTKSIYVKKKGKYSVTVQDISGCSTTKDTTIRFEEIETIIQSLGATEFCRGDSVELIASPIDIGSRFVWSTGATGYSIVVHNTARIILKILSANGCVKYDTVQVNVYDKLNANVVYPSAKSFCKGDTIIAKTNYEGDDFIFLWSNGAASPEIKLTDDFAGWVYVRLKSGCGDTAYFNVHFIEKPNVFISISKSATLCSGKPITLKALTNNTGSGLKYKWSTGDTTDKIKVSKSGRYFVTVTTESGCSNQAHIDINFLPAPIAKIEPTGPIELCYGSVQKLTAEPDNAEYSYLWSTGETTREISVRKSGEYFVVIKNKNNCTDTARISVTFSEKLNVKLKSNLPLKICKGSSVLLSPTKKYARYKWNTGVASEAIIVTTAGKYWLTVWDSNDCEGHSDTLEVQVSEVDILVDDLSKTKFGNVCIGVNKGQTFKIKNNGKENIEIKSMLFHSGKVFQVVTNPTLPAIIPKGGEIDIHLSFIPPRLGQHYDTLNVVVTSPCYFRYEMNIEGRGVIKSYVRVPDTVRPIGVKYCIPVLFYLKCGDTLKRRVHFKTKLSVDVSTFLPDKHLHRFVKKQYVRGNKRIFEIEGWVDALNDIPKEAFSICGTVLLGDFEWSNITLEELQSDNPNFSTIAVGGELEIYGVCEFNISRIKLSSPTVINVYKNRGDNDISIGIETAESGRFEIGIYSLTGIKRFSYRFTKNDDNKSEYMLYPDFSKFESGYYRLMLRTAHSVKSVPLIIYK